MTFDEQYEAVKAVTGQAAAALAKARELYKEAVAVQKPLDLEWHVRQKLASMSDPEKVALLQTLQAESIASAASVGTPGE